MEILVLKEKIESLNPKVHSSLIRTLMVEYNRLISEGQASTSPPVVIEDPFTEMFEKAVQEINKHYIEEVVDHIETFHPELSQKTNEAEGELNEVWKRGLQGKATLEEFQEVLYQWLNLNLGGIEIYSRDHKKEEAHRNEE